KPCQGIAAKLETEQRVLSLQGTKAIDLLERLFVIALEEAGHNQCYVHRREIREGVNHFAGFFDAAIKIAFEVVPVGYGGSNRRRKRVQLNGFFELGA